jgi:hypothetical protein
MSLLGSNSKPYTGIGYLKMYTNSLKCAKITILPKNCQSSHLRPVQIGNYFQTLILTYIIKDKDVEIKVEGMFALYKLGMWLYFW